MKDGFEYELLKLTFLAARAFNTTVPIIRMWRTPLLCAAHRPL